MPRRSRLKVIKDKLKHTEMLKTSMHHTHCHNLRVWIRHIGFHYNHAFGGFFLQFDWLIKSNISLVYIYRTSSNLRPVQDKDHTWLACDFVHVWYWYCMQFHGLKVAFLIHTLREGTQLGRFEHCPLLVVQGKCISLAYHSEMNTRRRTCMSQNVLVLEVQIRNIIDQQIDIVISIMAQNS